MPYANAAENRFLLPFCREAQKNELFRPFFSFLFVFFAARARFCRIFAAFLQGGGAAEARRINYSADFSEAVCDFSFALFINAQNSGLGVSGVEVNSGWNCTPTKKG